MNAQHIVQTLRMQPHPEGGFYKETYRCKDYLTTNNGKKRSISTAIYYLLENEDKSHFHCIQSDELWFFHQGQSLEITYISNQQAITITLGNDIVNGDVPQAVIPAHSWFAAKIKNSSGYALVSCTVAPGFDFEDFELADKKILIQQYPHLTDVIHEFTR